ncbi:hypothetical protein [Pseudokineococcus sp. 1T1Z-3]|uniref:hypothetical protein n=1 Tax=Pseudokineococcus sp. 1T1Z-3 TaxID=3132745 RepID=UPI003099C5D0
MQRLGLAGALAGVLVVLGGLVVVTAPPVTFGYFASAPPGSDGYAGPPLPLVLGGRQLAGLAAVVVGLVLAGLALGVQLGRRRPR